ncbi:MAG: hypothetical protein ACRDPW_07820 [Mycobacteriales bacterium]
MSTDVEIDAALEAVVQAARHHRAVLKSPAATDEEIWVAYTTLNNASVQYDDLVNQTYDEVTPWDCEYIDPDAAAQAAAPSLGRSGVASHTVMTPLLTDDDLSESEVEQRERAAGRLGALAKRAGPVPAGTAEGFDDGELLLCVRQRRDYVIADTGAVIAAAQVARISATGDEQDAADIGGLGEAIYALIEAGDGTLAALDDVDEIEPANGVVLVNQTNTPVPLVESDSDPELAFTLGPADTLLYRLDEVMSEEA